MQDIKIVTWTTKTKSRVVDGFLKRPAFSEDAEAAAAEVLADVRARGNAAVCDYARKFDGVTLSAARLRVTEAEIKEARKAVAPAFRAAVREAHRRIVQFSRTGKRRDWDMATPGGGKLGERYHAYDRIGAYIPGGKAPLASTALMTVTLAKVAGVKEIIACTPCGEDETVDPHILHALDVSGATEIYRVGGIHGVGMMAYGTRSVRKVQKIVGPGGAYVTAAKRQVYGHVALDLVAGPSEIAILADSDATPAHVAADLLSQAEHGTGDEKALCVTTSKRLAHAVQKAVHEQAATLSRRDAVAKVIRSGALIVTVPDLDQGMELCNRFAAEHLELMVKNPRRWLKKVRAAGAVFLGQWTPEAAGDFVAGPSHVLPTGGAAAMFSGLTVDDFLRRSSFVAFTRRDLQDTVEHIRVLAEVEGLDAHARSATIRFE